MTLLKDLIDIPEHVQKGDFVLRLTEGVIRAEETLRDYVVTPELTGCFDNALSFIRSALQSNTSKATYLHGSFGSGKSHFMAVLHLILQGNARARAIPELAPVISKHNEWILGKKFLLVPYHMIGAPDMESGILGGYVDFVRRTHPDAPIPGVYLAEGLFRDAENLRRQMGEAAFFKALNEGTSPSSGWGELAEGWDSDRFDAAIVADPGSEARSQLISVLISRFFGSYDTQAGGQGEAFLSLDKGLSVISKHAQNLGYDGLILFLDELVLWLASHAADLKFVHQEGQKLAKLVEAQTPDRPIPITSFVARQRDLSELIGDSVPGADRLNFGDALKHWEGRFHRITLEDRNLPAIAEKRLLKCKTITARQELDAAFERQKFRDSVMNTLLTREGDRKMFRQVYPFSPALVQTLIAVSSVLQRERTALKVMMQLLVEQRDVLTIGDIVPVGDLFDVIAHGDEAFSPEMAIHFNNAKRLYHQKLLPLLEKQHELRSALVPAVESLRELNGDRLATLNYGTIKTPIQGREGSEVLRRCKNWAASVGEIRIGQDANTTISIQLSGVDTEGILKQAEREDNRGNRVRLVKQMLFAMLFAQFTIKGETEFEQYYDFVWRNTKRPCVVLFGNIRELGTPSLEAIDERWKLVIDYPFDEPGHGPRDDLAKLQSFSESHPAGTKTLCWIPAFFSADAEKELGTLVLLEHILAGDRFTQYANDLSPQDRQAAKSLLENQRSVLRQRISNHLDAAYGLDALTPNSLDTSRMLELHERVKSLSLGLELKPPVAANLKAAMEHLLDQALSHEFPAAPNFEVDVNRINNLEKVYQVVSEAARATDGRAVVDKALRSLVRQIANPLKLGQMGQDATHFILGQDWKNHFIRKSSEVGGTISVKQLREWIDLPKPMGLPKEVQNLVILTYAEQTSRTFYRQTIPVDVTLKDLPNECELRDQKLPDEAHWQRAVQLTDRIFKFNLSSLLKPSNVTDLETKVKDKATAALPACRQYAQSLRDRLSQLNLAMDCDRLKTALATMTLLEQIVINQSEEIVSLVATAEIATTESAMADCLAKAATLHSALESESWDIFESIGTLSDERQTKAAAIHQSIQAALLSDEYVLPLSAELKAARSKAVQLLTQTIPQPPKPPTDPEPTPISPVSIAKPLVIPTITTPTKAPVRQGTQENLDLAAAQALLVDLQQTLEKGDNIQVNISWIIAPKGTTQ
jgi:hypothetical protein